ncbi:MAG TPA: outer membrane beta-barrel protein [Lysobacter sp.]
MFKLGCMALAAIACCGVVPAAHANGDFFIAGQFGQAKYDDVGLGDDTADTRAFSLGYRWQAGPVVQVGIEVGAGKVDEVTQEFSYDGGFYDDHTRVGIDARYTHVGANARFNFGQGSRWFAIARGGYMGYEQNVYVDFDSSYTMPDGTVLVSGSSYSSSEDGGGVYLGGGIGFDVTPNFNLNVMINGYGFSNLEGDGWNEDMGTATSTTFGLEARF